MFRRGFSRSFHLASALLGIALTLPSAHASDWYVDALSGSNSNSGTTPTTAWRTLTFAVSQLQAVMTSNELIHVAPGLYDTALGEQFPISMRPWIRILGTQGSASTILDGGGSDLLRYDVSPGIPTGYDLTCHTDGLTLRNGTTAITARTSWNPASPSFHDLRITSMSGPAVFILTTGFGPHQASPTFDGVRIDHCATGIAVNASSSAAPPGSFSSAILSDCSIEDCSGNGIQISANFMMGAAADLTRCRIVRNAGHGLAVGSGGTVNVTVSDSLLADNLQNGLDHAAVLGSCSITRCTFAHNGGTGVHVGGGVPVALQSSIFFGNVDDLALGGSNFAATHCDSGDGDLNGQPNCISADPLFVAAGAGDFRLAWGSPCIDSGDPSGPSGALDLAGSARPIDGDLDTQERPDRGCFEFAPLGLVTSGHIGTPLRLEMWGASGGTTTVFFSRHAPVAPLNTSFGQFDLDPTSFGTLLTHSVAPGPPALFQRPIPNSPALVGHTFSFQARTTSSAAPQGQAYTNVVSVTILP